MDVTEDQGSTIRRIKTIYFVSHNMTTRYGVKKKTRLTLSTYLFAGVGCVRSSFGSPLRVGFFDDLAVLSLIEDRHARADLLLEDPFSLHLLALRLILLQVIVIPG